MFLFLDKYILSICKMLANASAVYFAWHGAPLKTMVCLLWLIALLLGEIVYKLQNK